ncbi:hypothetical protein PG994_002383 [Apiospora phragmitis]|uniref:Uncharacterized protein n=1 Tax=Apiospora phragmitis TaxID=2905665 RepID=A0ABR1WWA2_9PEZI
MSPPQYPSARPTGWETKKESKPGGMLPGSGHGATAQVEQSDIGRIHMGAFYFHFQAVQFGSQLWHALPGMSATMDGG